MFTLRLFGGFALFGPTGENGHRLSQRRAEAVLALLSSAGPVGCSRDRLIALLWPESPSALARHSLRDVLHGLRQAVHPEVVLARGDAVTLNPAVVQSDVGRFTEARDAGQLEVAAHLYRGAFLDGFHVDDAPDFERWCDDERARLVRECAELLEHLALRGEAGDDWTAATAWWQRAAELDPHNSRLVLCLMRALVASGDRANALLRAEAHRRRLWSDLELEPDSSFELAVKQLRDQTGGAPFAVRRPIGDMPAYDTGQGPGSAAPSATSSRWPQAPPEEAPGNAPREAGRLSGATRAAPERRRWSRIMAITVLVVVLASAAGMLAQRFRSAPPPDPVRDLIVVLPFVSSGHDSLRVVAEELYGEVLRELADNLAPRPLDAVHARRAWQDARGDDPTRDPRAVDAVVSEQTRAALVMRGTLDSTAAGPALTFTIMRFPWRRVVAQRTALLGDTAFADARRLLLEVLALEAGEPEHRLGELSRHLTRPVRIYLDNARRIRPNQRRLEVLRQVWALDSALLYPGLQVFFPNGFHPELGPREDSVARAVWRRRERLAPEDRALTSALLGPWMGLADDAQQRIELWRRAAQAAPDWWLPSALLANELLSYGARASMRSWEAHAGQAMWRALEQTDWAIRPLVEMAFWHGIFRGDSTLSRRALDARGKIRDSTGVPGVRQFNYFWSSETDWPWLYDAAFGLRDHPAPRPDTMTQARINQAFRSLRVLVLAQPRAAILADSFAARWDRMVAAKPPQGMEWWVGFHWRTRGEFARWRAAQLRDYRVGWARSAAFDELADDVLYARDAIQFGIPADTAAKLAIRRMERIESGDSAPAPPIRARGIAACWLAQWRLSQGDTSGVGRAIALLRFLDAEDRAGRQDGLPGSGRWTVCPALLEAQRARVTGRDALDKARAFDRLLRPMPTPRRSWWSLAGNLGHDLIRPFGENVMAARLLAAAGDTAGALAASRRRPQGAAFQLDFFDHQTDHLRLEGQMAGAMADTLAAVAAYHAYLALRSNRPSYPPWRAEWDSVRAELARLNPLR